MKWKNSLRAAGLVATLSIGLFACNTESPFSPQEVIAQVLQETEAISSYYGEYTMDMGEVGGLAKVKEWTKDGKRRIEMTTEDGEHNITVYDGVHTISFDVVKNHVLKMELPEEQLEGLNSQSPKEQAEMTLNMVKDTHTISIANEEKIAGRDTYHIVAKTKKADTLFGDLDIWIDKKTWQTLKMTTISFGNKMTTEYTKMDTDIKIDDTKFILDIPKDATIEEVNLEDNLPEEVSLEVLKEKLGEFLMVPEADGLQAIKFEDMRVEERPEFAITYVKDDLPAFSVSVFKIVGNYTEFGGEQTLMEKEIEVRGKKGTRIEQGDFRLINWQENGYQYSIMAENKDLTVEDLLAYTEKMSIVQ
ncbi:outer membrane lipoprotein carrier protein LolA [Lysinibacillus sp. NPDC096418]|uniref:LolA family protein n=1 Tax=Lysinibacillus sp. NPDC096418 TaxID=3364138 RepID=UPI003810BE83